jgi:hypothetical protein
VVVVVVVVVVVDLLGCYSYQRFKRQT